MAKQKLIGKLREVITDKGIFYYKIEKSNTYDYLYLYEKKIEKIEKWWSSKIEIKETLINVGQGNGTNYDNDEVYFWLEQGENRIENIKSLIQKIIRDLIEFDPDWDGVVIEDKAKLRDILITKLQEDIS